MINLTQWESGLDVYLDPDAIVAITDLAPFQLETNECGRRTRVDYANGLIVLVSETAAEIADLIGND